MEPDIEEGLEEGRRKTREACLRVRADLERADAELGDHRSSRAHQPGFTEGEADGH